ncbi:MAG: hypothetical protein GKC03_00005 [Methanomassiliicoccales archaeon]|nr:hypothetical protein [Methanomassiliicoccales archaeon]
MNPYLFSTSTEEFESRVNEVIRNVRFKIRSKAELRRCGCPVCQEALERMVGK